MSMTRRDFLQVLAVAAAGGKWSPSRCRAPVSWTSVASKTTPAGRRRRTSLAPGRSRSEPTTYPPARRIRQA